MKYPSLQGKSVYLFIRGPYTALISVKESNNPTMLVNIPLNILVMKVFSEGLPIMFIKAVMNIKGIL